MPWLSLYACVSWFHIEGSYRVVHRRANAGLLLSYSTITPVSHITINHTNIIFTLITTSQVQDVSPSSAILFLQEEENNKATITAALSLPKASSRASSPSNKPSPSVSPTAQLKQDKKENNAVAPSTPEADSTNSRRNYFSNHEQTRADQSDADIAKSLMPEPVAWFIRLPDSMNADMPHDEELERQIDAAKRYLQRSRLKYVRGEMKKHLERQEKRADLEEADAAASGSPGTLSCYTPFSPPTLDIQYLSSMTSKERRAVNQLVRAVYAHNLRFCGDTSGDPTVWRRYVRKNEATGEEEFYPNWFMVRNM